VPTRERAAIRTQFLIFTLFGDYVLPRGGAIRTQHLLRLLDVLGVSERAARSTLSRMARRGWLIARREGRTSQYTLTARGWTLLEQGERRIFEPRFTQWDGLWHLIVYSVPEDTRELRHVLRRRLSWLGFGRLAPGTWITPHNRRTEVEALCVELGVWERVELFSGMHWGPTSDQTLVQRCWDLAALETPYREFIARYEREYEQCHGRPNGNGHARNALTPEQCFVSRFWLTHDFQSFPLRDPNLPVALLPPDWIGFAARELFDNYRRLLTAHANAYVDALMAGGNND
jgi:phenylacetic acid degradation operon negative regulatory protein